MHRLASSVAVTAALFAVGGCSVGDPEPRERSAVADPTTSRVPTSESPPAAPETGPEPEPAEEPVDADDLDRAVAVAAVRHLAGTIGPREATGTSYARAADWVERSFARMGFEVVRQRVDVPAGVSAEVAVPAGRSS